MSDASAIKESAGEAVDTVTLALLITSDVPMVLLDARARPTEHRRIPGAKSLPADSPASEVRSVLGSTDALIVAYSSDESCPASETLCRRLKDLGYDNVLKYPGGIDGWAAAGYPVEET